MALGIIQKANSRLKFLCSNATFLNRYVKQMLASSLIQCHFDYGCTFLFSGLSCKLKSKLHTPQNKIIRFVMGKHNRSHVGTTEFKELNWLPVEHKVAQIKFSLVSRIVNGSAPDYLQRTLIMSVKYTGTPHAIVNLPFVFLLLKVQRNLLQCTQQLIIGIICLRTLKLKLKIVG